MAGISILAAGSGPLYTNAPLRTPDFFIARCSAPKLLERVVDLRLRERGVCAEHHVVGHTDTTGPAAGNLALGFKRGSAIRDLLVEAGLDRSAVEVISAGERSLLVPTPDGTLEPRNRRVQITVR